jgi:Trk-type K+ transport system membrane component
MADATPDPRSSISDRCWRRMSVCLRCLVHRNPFRGYEEIYVGLRLAILAVLPWPAALGCYWFAMVIALIFAAEILLFNTAVVFITRRPVNVLRSVVLTMLGYVSLALAFVPVWIAFRYEPGNVWDQMVSGFYHSAGALTTTGISTADLGPGEKLFAIFETFVGIYFLAIIIAGYVSWMKGPR